MRGQGPCPHLVAVRGQGAPDGVLPMGRVRILWRCTAQRAVSAGGALHREQCPHDARRPIAAQRAVSVACIASVRDLGVGSSLGSCPWLLGRLSAVEEGEQSSSWGPCQRSPQRLAELCRRRRVSRSDLINGTEHGRLSAA